MSYRTITVGNGDTIRISESVLRGAGPSGPAGPLGPPGVATTIRGHFPTYDDLIATIPEGAQGDAYITDEDGILYTWDVESDFGLWISCGRIVGPASVMSVGATRWRNDQRVLGGNMIWIAEYQETTNDADSLGGFVLDESSGMTTPFQTVVSPADYMYYIVTTDFTIDESVYDTTTIEFSFLNTKDGSVSAPITITVNGNVDYSAQYQAILKTNNLDKWLLQVKPNNDMTVLRFTTHWNRIAGGPGPTGPPGPHPALIAGTIASVEHGVAPTWEWIESPAGVYTVNMTTPEGQPGDASAGFANFNGLIGPTGSSEADPGAPTNTWTDQDIEVPDELAPPHVPWYFRLFATSIMRKLVSRLPSAEITARGAMQQGEAIFDTTLNKLLLGQNTGSGVLPFTVPTIEYGQANIQHNQLTGRPDGSLYFKYDS